MAPRIKPVEYFINRINGEYIYTAWRGVKNVSRDHKEEIKLLNSICMGVSFELHQIENNESYSNRRNMC